MVNFTLPVMVLHVIVSTTVMQNMFLTLLDIFRIFPPNMIMTTKELKNNICAYSEYLEKELIPHVILTFEKNRVHIARSVFNYIDDVEKMICSG